MSHGELHEIMGEIEDVTGLSELHRHVLKVNDALEGAGTSDLVEEEEDHLAEWLSECHDTVASIADDLDAASYDLTLGGTSAVSFTVTFEGGRGSLGSGKS